MTITRTRRSRLLCWPLALALTGALCLVTTAGAAHPPLTLARLQAMMNTLGGVGESFDQLVPSLVEHPSGPALAQDVTPLRQALTQVVAKLSTFSTKGHEHVDVVAFERAANRLSADLGSARHLKGKALYRWLAGFINDNETFNKAGADLYRDVAPVTTTLGKRIASYQDALLTISKDAAQAGITALEISSSKSTPTSKQVAMILTGYRKLHADAQAALRLPPLGSAMLESEWSGALTDFADGASSSLNGLLQQSDSLLTTGEQELQAGASALITLFGALGIPIGAQA